MQPRLVDVTALAGYKLLLTFHNGEKRQFDMEPYLDRGNFRELANRSMFVTVRLSFDTVEWANSSDMDPEVLYSNSVSV